MGRIILKSHYTLRTTVYKNTSLVDYTQNGLYNFLNNMTFIK